MLRRSIGSSYVLLSRKMFITASYIHRPYYRSGKTIAKICWHIILLLSLHHHHMAGNMLST